MRHFSRLVSCAGFVALLVNVSYSKEWRGITPLHSTRQDVVRILGQAEDSGNLYNLAEAVVLISYSTGTCQQGGIWNVPRDTVERISVSPKKTFSISELQLKLKNYEIVADKHLPGIVYYNNADEGIHIQTYENNVTSIDYLPAANDGHLRCALVPVGLVTKDGLTIDSHTLFDAYGKLPYNTEQQHLDLFGRRLQDFFGARGYIVVYNGQGTSAREALSRANRAKTYLRRNYHGNDNSIEIVKGARRKEFTLELYLVPRVSQKPD
jgi:hypothetical protein